MSSFVVKIGQQGQALVQVLIAVGIAGILLMIIASSQVMQAKENQALAEKMAALDFQRTITQFLSSPSSCNTLFAATNLLNSSTFPFDATNVSPQNPVLINLKQIPLGSLGSLATAGAQVSPLANTLYLLPNQGTQAGIQVQITSVSPPTATLALNFDQTKLVRSIHNLQFPINLTLSGAVNATTVTGCSVIGSGGYQCFNVITSYKSVPASELTQLVGIPIYYLMVGGGGGSSQANSGQNGTPVSGNFTIEAGNPVSIYVGGGGGGGSAISPAGPDGLYGSPGGGGGSSGIVVGGSAVAIAAGGAGGDITVFSQITGGSMICSGGGGGSAVGGQGPSGYGGSAQYCAGGGGAGFAGGGGGSGYAGSNSPSAGGGYIDCGPYGFNSIAGSGVAGGRVRDPVAGAIASYGFGGSSGTNGAGGTLLVPGGFTAGGGGGLGGGGGGATANQWGDGGASAYVGNGGLGALSMSGVNSPTLPAAAGAGGGVATNQYSGGNGGNAGLVILTYTAPVCPL